MVTIAPAKLPWAGTEPRTVADLVVRSLADHGIRRIFGVPGGPISPIIDATLNVPGVEFTTSQQETMAVYTAMGYARATGRAGVVAVTSGPGILNAATGIAAACHDEVPLVVLAGEIATGVKGRPALQDGTAHGLDVGSVMRPLTKASELLEPVFRARVQLTEALALAERSPSGPVVIRIPVDAARLPMVDSTVEIATPVPMAHPPDEVLVPVVEALSVADRVAILLGGRAARHPECAETLQALVEKTNAVVGCDLEAKGLFPESHPKSLGLVGVGSDGRAEGFLENGVDVLLLVGMRLDDTTTSNYSPLFRPDNGLVVQIDAAGDRLARAYAVDVAVSGSIPAILRRVTVGVRARKFDYPPVSSFPPRGEMVGDAPFNPRGIPPAIQRVVSERTVYVSDIGNHLLFAARGLKLDSPRFHASMGLGGMGSGIGMAIGFAFARPDNGVVCICGDGGMLMAGTELASCVHHNLDATFIVFNDSRWGMVIDGSQRVYGRCPNYALPQVDLVQFARSLGANAIRPTTEDELVLSLQSARKGTWLIDVPIDPDVSAPNPRDEVINFGQ